MMELKEQLLFVYATVVVQENHVRRLIGMFILFTSLDFVVNSIGLNWRNERAISVGNADAIV